MSPGNSHDEGAMAPLVSVIMPVYNGERYLAEAIESILTQTLGDLELIVVDDCSTDGSAAIARDYASRDERLQFLRHDRNRGGGPARNSGIAVARGKFIAGMDCDDVSLPQRLEKQVAFLQSNPDIGVVGAFLQTVGPYLSERQTHAYPQQHAFIVLHWILGGRTTMSGGAMLARREALLSVGGHADVHLAEDRELFSRLYFKTRFATLPEALYLYRSHDSQLSASAKVRQQRRVFDLELRQRWLKRVTGSAPRATLERFERLHWSEKFGWREWWLLRRDVKRLLKGMVEAQVLVGCDIAIAEMEMRRRLESATPRWWQMFLHWRRHHFSRGG